MQALCKRFYYSFVSGLILRTTLFELGRGYFLLTHQSKLCVLDPRAEFLQWRDLPVFEKGSVTTCMDEESQVFSYSKIVQVNHNDVYIIGGEQNHPSLLSRGYEVASSCFKIEIKGGQLEQKPNMITGRWQFGVCALN